MASDGMFAGYKTFFERTELADLTVTCGERRWKVHAVIVSANSEFFRKACTGEFKEAKSRTIDLKDDSDDAVNAMIYYLYHGTYDSNKHMAAGSSTPAFHPRVLAIADKYAINGLATTARDYLVSFAVKSWNCDGFADLVDQLYNSELRDLAVRKHIIKVTHEHYPSLFASEEKHHKFKEVARAQVDFLYDLVVFTAKEDELMHKVAEPQPTRNMAQLQKWTSKVADMRTDVGTEVDGYAGRLAALEWNEKWAEKQM